MRQNQRIITVLLALLLGSVGGCVFSNKEAPVLVGGGVMNPDKNIIENVVYSNDHTTLVTAIRAAELVGTLTSPGPFTVFAPTNAAFEKLPPGTVDALLARSNKPQLQTILEAHVIARKLSAAELISEAKRFKNKYQLKTVSGVALTVAWDGETLTLTDPLGDQAKVDIADVQQSNGIVHVIDTVMIPQVLALK